MKVKKREVLLTALVCLLPVLAGAALYPRLPETMATHWGVNGEVNGWMPRAAAVFALPLFLLAVHLLCCYAAGREARRGSGCAAMRTVTLWICPAVSLLCGTVTLGTGLGYAMQVGTLVPLFVGVLFLILGNYLPKTRQNAAMGIRLPWTLASEENWNHTHRVAGFTWVAAGLLLLLSALLRWNACVSAAALLLAIAVPVLFSYCYARREKKHGDG